MWTGNQNIYFIFTVCLPAPATANAAALNFGGPKVILGLREKPKPSLGIASEVSSLPLAFSSWISDKAYVPGAKSVKLMLPTAFAFTVRLWALLSLVQSGKALLLAVRQTSTWPLVLRKPVTDRSRLALSAAASGAPLVKAAKTQIGVTNTVPKPKVEPIIPPISIVMFLMVCRCYQPITQRTMNKRTRK